MKSVYCLVGLLLTASAPMRAATVAIRDVTVVDVRDGRLRIKQTVLIEDDRITAVAPADDITIPDGADVIDGTGAYLIPGLWDMHAHSVTLAPDSSIVTWHLPLFLAHGVTGVRNMNDGTGDRTLAAINSVKRRLAIGELHGPRLYASGPTVDGDPPIAFNPIVVRNADEARDAVGALADAGADFVKVYENVSREAYSAIMEEARRKGIGVDGHLPFRMTPQEAAAAGQRTVEHLTAMAWGCSTRAAAEREAYAAALDSSAGSNGPMQQMQRGMLYFRAQRALYDSRDPAACTATVDVYRTTGMAATPTLVAWQQMMNPQERLETRLVPDAVLQQWQGFRMFFQMVRPILQPAVALMPDNVRLLNEAGVVLLAGTDVGPSLLVPGLSLHEELRLLVKAGLTPLEALRTATLNPARVLGLADSLGTVEPGKLADLVLLDANPLADISNALRIRAVVANGRIYRRGDIDRLMHTARGG